MSYAHPVLKNSWRKLPIYQKKSKDLSKQDIPLGMLMSSNTSIVPKKPFRIPIVPNNKLKLSGSSWVFYLLDSNMGIHYSKWVSGYMNYINYEYIQYVIINYHDKIITFKINITNNDSRYSLYFHFGSDSNNEKIIIEAHNSKMFQYFCHYSSKTKPVIISEIVDWTSKFSLDGSWFTLEESKANSLIHERKYRVENETYYGTTMASNNYILMLDDKPVILCPSYRNSQCDTLMNNGILFIYDPISNQWLKEPE